MKRLHKKERMLLIAAGMLMLSILMMIIVLPGVYTKTLPYTNNSGAAIGISLAIIVRLLILVGYRFMIRSIRLARATRKTAYILIGILLLLFGLIYSDGAVSFLPNTEVPYVAYLMFTSVLFDLLAAILTFMALFLKGKG